MKPVELDLALVRLVVKKKDLIEKGEKGEKGGRGIEVSDKRKGQDEEVYLARNKMGEREKEGDGERKRGRRREREVPKVGVRRRGRKGVFRRNWKNLNKESEKAGMRGRNWK